MLVSVHIEIATADTSDLACVLDTYTIPPMNSSQYYVPPDPDRPEDLKCKCDSVMYRYASAQASRRSDRFTDGGGPTGIQPLYGMHDVSGRCHLFVSFSRRVCARIG